MTRPWFAALPPDRSSRWARVHGFLRAWGIAAGEGASVSRIDAAAHRLGVGLPAALRELYRALDPTGPAASGQDFWLPLERLRIAEGCLVVRVENQACAHWGIRLSDLGADDPPVVELESGQVAEDQLSAFAIKTVVYEAGFGGPGTGHLQGELDEAASGDPAGSAAEGWAREADRRLVRVPVSERYWVCTPLRMWEAPGVVLLSTDGGFVYGAVADRRALGRIWPLVQGFEVDLPEPEPPADPEADQAELERAEALVRRASGLPDPWDAIDLLSEAVLLAPSCRSPWLARAARWEEVGEHERAALDRRAAP